MPTATFFRLPQEKRERLMDACWAELSRVRFSDVSINRIVSAARIPRGSFYQYFGGKDSKEELFRFFLEDVREYFIRVLRSVLTEGQGDLFALPLKAFDRFLRQGEEMDPTLLRLIQILRMNPGFDPRSVLSDCPGVLPDQLWEVVDPSALEEQDRVFADHVFFLCVSILAYALMATVMDPDQRDRQREILQKRVEMIRCGCAAPWGREKEEII